MNRLPKQSYSKHFLSALVLGVIAYVVTPESASNLIFTFFDATNPSVFEGLAPFGHYKMGFAVLIALVVFILASYATFCLILSLQTPKGYVEISDKPLVVQRYVDHPALINRHEFEVYLNASEQSKNLPRPTKADYNAALTAIQQA